MTENEKYELTEKIRADLINVVIWGGAGWFLLFLVMGRFFGTWTSVLIFIASILVASRPIRTGSLKGLYFWKTYEWETETTYADGSRKTTTNSNFPIMASYWGLALLVGMFLVLAKFVWLTVKYATFYAMLEQKPPFLKSGFLIAIIGLVIFFGGGTIIPAVGRHLHEAPERALNKTAQIFAMDIMEDNGLQLKMTEIRYREDATIIYFMETKQDGLIDDNVYNEPSYEPYTKNVRDIQNFTITAPSGAYTAQSRDDIRSKDHVDDGVKDPIGIEFRYPPFKDTTFSVAEDNTYGNDKLIKFTNVTVQ
ncbi:MAG: hypothetical protein LBV04_01655 [Deferribacteraceae bacterium]|jgi:hypothetical protein|nr:hypothetical protein [Deferribacteraceae bacterium]